MPDIVEQNTAPPEHPEAQQLRERAEAAERELALRRALNGIDWFEAEDAYRELARNAERSADGQWQITLPAAPGETEPRRIAPVDAARDLAKRKPHWVRARILGGSGAGGGNGAPAGSSITYLDLLRPENEPRLKDYLHNRPDELDRLRQAHFKK